MNTVARGQLKEDSYFYTGVTQAANGYREEHDELPRVLGAVAVDLRAEARAQAREPGNLPEVGKELLDLALQLVEVSLTRHRHERYPRPSRLDQ